MNAKQKDEIQKSQKNQSQIKESKHPPGSATMKKRIEALINIGYYANSYAGKQEKTPHRKTKSTSANQNLLSHETQKQNLSTKPPKKNVKSKN